MLNNNKGKAPAKSGAKLRLGGPRKPPASSTKATAKDNLSMAPLRISRAAPIAMASEMATTGARFSRRSDGVNITHREFLGNLANTNGFSQPLTVYPLNPGIPTTFPWLSNIAAQYDQYRFRSLRFLYITRCATIQSGSVILAPDYDASDPPPISEVQITTYKDVVEDVPWRNIVCTLSIPDLHAMGPRKFVRTFVVSFADIKTYDCGNLFIATVGTDTNALGKIWVEYSVELYAPTLQPTLALLPTFSTYARATTAPLLTNAAQSLVLWDTVLFNPLNIIFNTVGPGSVLVLPRGSYLITVVLDFNVMTASTNLGPWSVYMYFLVNGAQTVPQTSVSPSAYLPAGSTSYSQNTVNQLVLVSTGATTFQVNAESVNAFAATSFLSNVGCNMTIQPA
jgi:hypothetical protein